MIRGTTPTITIRVPVDLSEWETVWVTFEHAKGQLTKTGAELAIESGGESAISMKLTQEDTLSFPEKGKVAVQMRAEKNGGADAIASTIGRFRADEVLLEEVIPLGG